MRRLLLLFSLLFTIGLVTSNHYYGSDLTPHPEKTIEGDNYDKAWNKVDSLEKRGLPKSALEVVNTIYRAAKNSGNQPQIVKCLIHQLKFADQHEENAFNKGLENFQKEISNSSPPLKNVLNSALGELYWWYYQHNRWRILQRTTVDQPDSADIETWDLKKIAETAESYYLASLENETELKNTPTKEFGAVLSLSINTAELRPSLYDLLAHRAIEFLANGEAGLSTPFENFKMDGTYLKPHWEFALLNIPQPNDPHDFNYRAISIMQNLTKIHKDNIPALIDIELIRLQFVKRLIPSTPANESIYYETLSKLKSRHSNDPPVTRVAFEMAQFHAQKGGEYNPLVGSRYKWERKKALDLCREQIDKFPESYGAKQCKDLSIDLLAKELTTQTEKAYPANKPILAFLKFRNLEKVHVKILREKNIIAFKDKRLSTEEWLDYYNKLEIIHKKTVNVPQDGDLQLHGTELDLPALSLGRYILLVSEKDDFRSSNLISYSDFFVSNISYLTRNTKSGNQDVFVNERSSGEPISKVKIAVYSQNYDYSKRSNNHQHKKDFVTDENGTTTLEDLGRSSSFNAVLTYKGDTLAPENSFQVYRRNPNDQERKVTHYFTDRAIYRPGQTIHFKGIVLGSRDRDHRVITNEKLKVQFYDVNGQVISELDLKTNEFGTFHGSFAAPSGGLNGQMRIQDTYGSKSVQVEEYKRPKFEITFNQIEGAYKINQNVEVTGNLKSFSGVNLDGAEVKYSIYRTTQYRTMYWYLSSYWSPSRQRQEISKGTITTQSDGTFKIDFKALGDEAPSKNYYPYYQFNVEITATDITGESHSATQTVYVSKKSLNLSASVGKLHEKNEKLSFPVSTTNLNGKFLETDVTLKIYKIKGEDRLLRFSDAARPDTHLLSKEEFIKLFPHDRYEKTQKPEQTEVYDTTFTSSDGGKFEFDIPDSWQSGNYAVVLEAKDPFGEDVNSRNEFLLFDQKSKTPTEHIFFDALFPKSRVEVGEKLPIVLYAADKATIRYEIEVDREIVKSELIRLKNEQKTIFIDVPERYRGNFHVHLTTIRENSIFQESRTIVVPFTNKMLDIEFSSFRDKLLPGEKETYNITIKSKKGEAVNAELLTSMYDASLDQFTPHYWSFFPHRAIHYSQPPGYSESFGVGYGRSLNFFKFPNRNTPSKVYERLYWFDYSYGRYGQNITFIDGIKVRGSANLPRQAMAMDMEEISGGVPMQKGDVQYETKGFSRKMPAVLTPESDNDQVNPEPELQIRKNLNETAFFYPDLTH